MSDSGYRWLFHLFLCLAASTAQALDLAAPFVDPLETLPAIVDTDSVLPGDNEPVPCPAVKDFSDPLTLVEAVDLALCNNPQISSAWAAIKVQAGALGETKAAYLPTLSATANYVETQTVYSDKTMSSTTMRGPTIYGTLSWRIFDFGGREANRASANHLLMAAMANHDAALQKLLAAVIQTYFDAQTSKAVLQSKEHNESIARSTLETAQRREARGAASRSDVLQATTALAQASLETNRASGGYQKALSVLAYVLGASQQPPIVLADDLIDNGDFEARCLEEWLDLAAKTHPAIRSAREKWESAKQKIAATRSEGLPTLEFSDRYYQNGYPDQGLSVAQSRSNTIGLTITIPLFDGFSRTYKVRGAEALAEQREADLQDILNNTLMEIVKAHAEATASMKSLQASETLFKAAEDSLSASKRRYEKGAADILEILNTQKALSDAQQERTRSLAEWRSARLRLLTSVGLMGRTTMGLTKDAR